MQVQYHEFAASVEDASDLASRPDGKTAYAALPEAGEPEWIAGDGQAVNGCNCGIGGIGINGNASEDLQAGRLHLRASGPTSKNTQFEVLKGARRDADP